MHIYCSACEANHDLKPVEVEHLIYYFQILLRDSLLGTLTFEPDNPGDAPTTCLKEELKLLADPNFYANWEITKLHKAYMYNRFGRRKHRNNSKR